MAVLRINSSPQDFVDHWRSPAKHIALQEKAKLSAAATLFPVLFDKLYELLSDALNAEEEVSILHYADFASFCLRHKLPDVERELAERVYVRAATDPNFGLDDLCDNISFVDFETVRPVLLTLLPLDVVLKMESLILDEEVIVQ